VALAIEDEDWLCSAAAQVGDACDEEVDVQLLVMGKVAVYLVLHRNPKRLVKPSTGIDCQLLAPEGRHVCYLCAVVLVDELTALKEDEERRGGGKGADVSCDRLKHTTSTSFSRTFNKSLIPMVFT
jgi:hypothetical protein